MQETKVEIKNDVDLSLIDHEFIMAMLDLILKDKEQENGLHQN